MTQYDLELKLSDAERFALTVALAKHLGDIEKSGRGDSEAYAMNMNLLRRLWEALPPQASAPTQASAPNAAVGRGDPVAAVATARPSATHMTPEPSTVERKPLPEPTKDPEGELTLTLISAEPAPDGKSLLTKCKTRYSNGTRINTLRCWDPKEWDRIKASVGKSTTFLTRESKGFTNIVGVKA